jgi:hypothetical protein
MSRHATALIAAWPGQWVRGIACRNGRSHHRRVSWVGSVTCGPGAAGPTPPTAFHDTYSRELAGLLEPVLAGDLDTDWVSIERGMGSALAASVQLHEERQVDNHGRCLICREDRWPWPAGWSALFVSPLPATCRTPPLPTYEGCSTRYAVSPGYNKSPSPRHRPVGLVLGASDDAVKFSGSSPVIRPVPDCRRSRAPLRK